MSIFKLSAIGAALVAAIAAVPAPALAGALGTAAAAPRTQSAIVRVHDNGYRHKHRYSRRSGPVIVDAPTTYVETYNRRVWVDAPFTAVRVHPRGVWVRAPFVNLYVPR